jgi:hypothetical protein
MDVHAVAWSVAELWRSRIAAPRIGSPIDSLGQSRRPRGEQGRPERPVRRGFARRGFPYGCSPLGQRARKRSSRSASTTSINESGPPRSRAARRTAATDRSSRSIVSMSRMRVWAAWHVPTERSWRSTASVDPATASVKRRVLYRRQRPAPLPSRTAEGGH